MGELTYKENIFVFSFQSEHQLFKASLHIFKAFPKNFIDIFV